MGENALLNNIEEKKKLSKSEIIIHKDIALQKLNALFSKYIDDTELLSNANKLAYWLENYCDLLDFEKEFKPYLLKNYSRGDVIKVNLGYNIGNEEGGLHYCIVVDKQNSMFFGIITVIPLTSDKGKKLHFSEVNIGNEIYTSFKEKHDSIMLNLSHRLNSINFKDSSQSDIGATLQELSIMMKMDEEMSKMKEGSIALVSQITTISKQRIYDPQKARDILSGIHISDASLDLINNKMKQLFIKK